MRHPCARLKSGPSRAGLACDRSVRELIEALKDNIENMKKQSKELEADEKGMDAKVGQVEHG